MIGIHIYDLFPDCKVLQPIGELDAFTVTEFRAAIAEIREPHGLIIDLSSVPFVDSAGLGALIGGVRRTRELGGQVALVCPRPSMLRLFRSTGTDRIAPVLSTLDDATEILQDADVYATSAGGG